MITQINNSLYDQFIADFEERSVRMLNLEDHSVLSLRKKALEQFKVLGFPTNRVEDWKYTNIIPFLNNDFSLEQPGIDSVEIDIQQFRIVDLDCYQIVLLNGKYQPQLSDRIVNENSAVLPLKESYKTEIFQKHFGHYTDINKHHFAALNTTFFNDGLFLELKDRTVLEKPLHIIHLFDA